MADTEALRTASLEPLRLWFITDGRLGHLNQLKGLAERLSAKRECDVRWLNITLKGFKKTGRDGLLRQFGSNDLPDAVFAAGSRCHIPLLWAGWICRAKTVVLMKPSWPLSWFSAAIVPTHDAPPSRDNVLPTQGVLNAIVPHREGRDAHRGLILLGGLNKHFHWHSDDIIEQIVSLAQARPEVHWQVSDSPRSPQTLLPDLARRNLENVQVMPFGHSGGGWLQGQLAEAGQVWVSRDSVSMVYESISSAAPTGLLHLQAARDSRVTRSMQQVVEAGLAVAWESHDAAQPLPNMSQPLWEADRAADWLLANLLRRQPND
ncbi:hypothetical protein HCU74_17210 [Spongiibacter sp. KMU-166]|uniref:Nucleoside-diphosphate sugar epimerase n=1 Tax=Spongiibacter thalassae TaxID=2721624 RepID=A0ABX1GKY1_9GAMM|nr:ELM1/GtrOC1 family putative glycosyltransferase [Spongiibacter thalassae]NKI19148.1 hypothetical protein [Spongiibacter thalassae]